MANGTIDCSENVIRGLKTDFVFCGMDVDIDAFEREVDKEDDTGLFAMQEFLISLGDGRINDFVFDDAVIDKSIKSPIG